MKVLLLLLLGVWGTPIFDLQRKYKSKLSYIVGLEHENVNSKKQRRVRRLYKKKKWFKAPKYKLKHHKLVGANAKDHRFSNQRTLRRFYRNS